MVYATAPMAHGKMVPAGFLFVRRLLSRGSSFSLYRITSHTKGAVCGSSAASISFVGMAPLQPLRLSDFVGKEGGK